MALLYDPGHLMPADPSDFAAMSWLISWPDGPWHLHDVEVGGTVLLVDSGPAQRIVWETRVTHSFAVPYESVNDLAVEILRRWDSLSRRWRWCLAASASDGERSVSPARSRPARVARGHAGWRGR